MAKCKWCGNHKAVKVKGVGAVCIWLCDSCATGSDEATKRLTDAIEEQRQSKINKASFDIQHQMQQARLSDQRRGYYD